MRYGSDYARSWARRLRFGDVRAKAILMAICNYVDEQGMAYPSVATLAEDTDQSPDSARRRLKDLEGFGVLVRLPRWVDGNGKANADGRGARTSDELRLLFEVTQETVDKAIAMLRGETAAPAATDDAEDGSPRVDPPLASGEGGPPSQQQGAPRTAARARDSLELKEDNPPTPLEGGREEAASPKFEATSGGEGWDAFEAAFSADGEPIARQTIARQVFATLLPEERATVTKAAEGYLSMRRRQAKPGAKLGGQTFLRERDAWPRYVELAPKADDGPKARFIAEGEPLFAALSAAYRIATGRRLEPHGFSGRAERGIATRAEATPDLLALGGFADLSWITLEAGVDAVAIAAWRDWLKARTGFALETLREQRRDADGRPLTRTMESLNGTIEVPSMREVIHTPARWPPRRDGTFAGGHHAATGKQEARTAEGRTGNQKTSGQAA